MQRLIITLTSHKLLWRLVLLLSFPALTAGLWAAPAKRLPVVPKWDRLEQTFKSSVNYTNPLQEATLTVTFTSPMGETSQVNGFWDGDRVWRVRFSPNQLGRWQFKTTCSDPRNQGLHNQAGEFICSAPVGQSRFRQHGPIRVALDHRHLEHADGTPFFWLADTIWNGPRVSQPRDWDLYIGIRTAQKFTVAQWSVTPGADLNQESALTGFSDRIGINPRFFQRLDAKLERLSRAGILSAIAPLNELAASATEQPLPADQAALLVRYVVARWGAEPVVWLLAFEGDSQAKQVGRWKRIGQAVFGQGAHAPVMLYPGDTPWLLDEFRDQAWVDLFGFQSVTDVTEDALQWTFAGPFPKEWTQQPARPLIPFTPAENGTGAQSKKRFSANDVRHAAYWSLLQVPPAGLSYDGQGVANWDTTTEPKSSKAPGARLPLWHKALFMPGAKQMGILAGFMSTLPYWQLRPAPQALSTQPGDQARGRQIVAASTETKDLALVYVPEDRALDLVLDALPPRPTVTWFNPRTGQTESAGAVVNERASQFPTPGPGDWVLVMRAGK